MQFRLILIYFSFKRPVSIGIYGHPSHELSHYTLLIFQVIEINGKNFDIQKSANEDLQETNNPQVTENFQHLLSTK
jgi:hypothetical protein